MNVDAFSVRRFSQFGEDSVLACWFANRRRGFYVDIGCHHPYLASNTAMLHRDLDWHGINVDVDDRAIEEFNRERPDDINLVSAVGRVRGRLPVTIYKNGLVNSLHPDWIDKGDKEWSDEVVEKKVVDVLTLADIFGEYLPRFQAIDFLDVDVEGLDLDVLAGNDWGRFRPEAIAVEVHNFNVEEPTGSETYNFLRAQGYKLHSFAVATAIFLNG